MKLVASILGLLFVSSLSACAADAQSDVSSSTDALTRSHLGVDVSLRRGATVNLPDGDACRAVLGPLALGLSQGLDGMSGAHHVDVSETAETWQREYTFEITASGARASYSVILDNDDSDLCFLTNLTRDDSMALGSDSRTPATAAELRPGTPAVTLPAGDPCATSLATVAQALSLSHTSPSFLLGTDVALVAGSTTDYSVVSDGKPFVANGTTFDNDAHFGIFLANTGSPTCAVESAYPTP